MHYKLVIFDFDGTLADSFSFFLSVFNQLAQQYRFKPIALEDVPDLRRHSARQMMKHVGLPKWKFPLVAKSFIGLMKKHKQDIPTFDGTEEILARLAESGMRLAIVSSNSYTNISQILGQRSMQHFDIVECGASVFGKSSRLKKVLKKTGFLGADAIYIGDQETDLEAARVANIAFGAVSWGYADILALKDLNPDEVFYAIPDIGRLADRQKITRKSSYA